ncbi:hypothetical protein V2K59_23445, partial [Pseudomonas alliivorans]|nr:hypothetical protein [Pseudomonas alliivorans]
PNDLFKISLFHALRTQILGACGSLSPGRGAAPPPGGRPIESVQRPLPHHLHSSDHLSRKMSIS